MKIFLYKTAIIAIVFFILFEITIGYRITKYKNEVYNLFNKQNINQIVNKLKDEIRDANQKENYLSEEDRVLLSTFINKIKKELDTNNK
tara:strand:- start:806 stop:1072 length:267 start_codon:yes stop_codon:yes gene_type:complete